MIPACRLFILQTGICISMGSAGDPPSPPSLLYSRFCFAPFCISMIVFLLFVARFMKLFLHGLSLDALSIFSLGVFLGRWA